MSLHPVTIPASSRGDQMEGILGLLSAVIANIRLPSDRTLSGNVVTYVFTPDLTANQTTAFNDLVLLYGFGLASNLTLAEFQAIKPDLATAKAYVSIASPTAAQTSAALKSTIRVLGALLRS